MLKAMRTQSNKQRIWIVSELYYPELTSTGYFVTGIAEGLAQSYSVSVLCGQPSYWKRGVRAPVREMLNDVQVRRCWATTLNKNRLAFKILNSITLSFSLFWAALFHFKRQDIVVAVTNPPMLPYVMVLACRFKGARLVLLIHDVYPEIFTRLGILKQHSIPVHLMSYMACWLYKAADRIIVLGRDMRELVVQKIGGRTSDVVIASNWGDVEAIFPSSRRENRLLGMLGLKDSFVVQFCGNIGRTHSVEDLVEVAAALRAEPEFHFLVIGWGAKKSWLIKQKQLRDLENMTVLQPLLDEEFCDGLNACDIAIIPFLSGMSGISVPSRMYNILASGKPILAVCNVNSELATVVKEEGVGWVVDPGQTNSIVSMLRQAKADPALLRSMGERARKAAEAKYTMGHVLEIYSSVIEEMGRE
jgi:glycosyltransferase involved in cell wall biosynthesis